MTNTQSQKRIIIMKKRILALACTAALLAFGSEAQAVSSATGQADATAKIVTALTITNSNKEGLSFGTMVPGIAGKVTVDKDGTGHFAGPTQIDATGSPTRAAAFTVTGGAGYACGINAEDQVVLTGVGGEMNATLTESATSLSLDVNGKGAFSVGGVLDVAANQKPGIYSGIFKVTVTYQ
jgi:hypothetical protein